jgi:hypothetical protein
MKMRKKLYLFKKNDKSTTMKKGIILMLFVASLFAGLTSLQASFNVNSTVSIRKSTVEFKIVNDTNEEFNYCVNGGHNYIPKGGSKGFSYAEGTELKTIEGGNCGRVWLKITADMHGKSFRLSELR